MLQDIKPYKLYNEYKGLHLLPPDENSLLVIREGGMLLLKTMEAARADAFSGDSTFSGASASAVIQLPGVCEAFRENEMPELTYLISVDDTRFYMPEFHDAVEKNAAVKRLTEAGYFFSPAGNLRYPGPDWLRYGALTAWQTAGWYHANRFCGKCGAEMKHSGTERAVICESCGNIIYPRLCPVVIAGVIRDNKILLTQYANRGRYARYALVAGFAEIGETIEETVAREVMEETGLKVRNLRYYKSQPWAFSESLLFGFFCEAEENAAVTVDGEELSLATWTERDAVPDYGEEISLTYEMMCQFRNNAEITRY